MLWSSEDIDSKSEVASKSQNRKPSSLDCEKRSWLSGSSVPEKFSDKFLNKFGR